MIKRLLPMLLAGLLLPYGSGHSASFVLRKRIDLPSSGGVGSVTAGDFNGDGRDDLATAAQGDLEVYLQRADGTLAPRVRIDFPEKTINVVQKADLGADGTMQILAGHSGGLAVYTWDGAGFQAVDHPAVHPCVNLASADLDGDGALDVFCVDSDADAMLYYSDPATVLAAPVYMQTAASGDVLLDDVTGDGHPDLLISSLAANSFFVYAHDGARSFLPAVAYTYPNEHSGSMSIAALDVDQDGAKEVVVGAPVNRPRSVLYIYRQGAGGYLELSKTVPTLDIPAAFKAADIDADGDSDLLVGHFGWQTLGRYMGTPGGLAAAELWSNVPAQAGLRTLAVGDFNGDGYADVAVGASLLYGGRSVSSDLDADLRSDLVWRNGTEVILWLSASSADAHGLGAKDASWSSQAIGDFDGDGEADLFWRNLTTGANEIRSAGTSLLPATPLASQDWQVAGAGDFDGDGRSDLFWRNKATGANSIWKSGDSALFQATSSLADLGWNVAGVGDFDGDGNSDVVWRHAKTGRNEIWRRGRSDLRMVLTTVTDPQWRIAGVGDFNGDHKDDMAWRNGVTGANAIWLSADSQTQLPVTSVTDSAWSIAAVGDYDGDARADLMWHNTSNGANIIWRGAVSSQKQTVTATPGWSLMR
jgi:hypothetical protein